ncbi:NAD(P)/FAD-dependent oxidoreductase [Anaerotruncus rubiinfantis]|uniref:NAD(P)/FAD-dependent oxidoreductase n=1 Tax=Anaerotruncus rubiinfantis TaxID=1720200 RepID=UPI0034A52660
MKYAIIGFGCAGYHAAKAIRQTDSQGEIHVFEAGDAPPANPMLTTYYAADKLPASALYPFGGLEEIAGTYRLRIHTGAPVEKIDAENRAVILSSGQIHPFDRILISTGARAFLPGIEGLPDSRVFLMRTVGDAQALRDRLEKGDIRHAVVVGASMVGIKVAELIWKADIPVTLADGADYLFPLAAFAPVAREIERRLVDQGYAFKWGAPVKGITPQGVTFADGETLSADLICICIGTRANVELVANTQVVEGQPIAVNRGIVADETMATSCPGIYAAGDCCEGINLQTGQTMIIGLWANAASQGETAGKNMAGGSCRYPGNIVHNITHFMDMDFIGLGDNRLEGETISCGALDGDFYIQATLREKRLQCVNILGNHRISGALKSLLIRQINGQSTRIAPAQRAMLLSQGLSSDFLNRIGGIGDGYN